jgi:hypothetical protein
MNFFESIIAFLRNIAGLKTCGWNTTQLGFIQGLDPLYYVIAHATSKVATELKRQFPAKTKLPKFHLVYCTPKTTFKGKELRTKAYAIEREKSTSADMMKILKSVYRVSFQMRAKLPKLLHV